jgi:DNA invertase Pin-like site-specific DNA recombinase
MSSAKSTKRTSKATVVGVKRAAIYVRVSSERQSKTKGSDGKEAEKESPQAQERDCRALAEKQGYVIVAVYRDVEKYRVGKRLVEPSGTRADRPQLRAMLADARKGDFDVILAWREDRLYRGYRPMLDVLDCLEETGLDIELAKEHFDKAIAPVKAWAARMELQAKHDRQMMGMAGRLAQGKAWSNIAPYGYQVVDGFFVEDGNESQWIRLMWQMFGDGESVGEIRRRLIASGARQRKDTKYPWGRHIIYQIFWCDYYYTGLYRVEWDSKNYILPMPVIVDADVAARVKGRLAQWKAYPAGNLKATALVAGLAYCEKCGAKMAVRELQNGKNHRYSYYRCNTFGRNNTVPGCAKSVRIYRIDDDVWGKLWKLISVPGELEAAIEKRVTELQAQEFDATAECEKLQKKLDDLAMMRQEAIALFQSKIISEADLKLRLNVIKLGLTIET